MKFIATIGDTRDLAASSREIDSSPLSQPSSPPPQSPCRPNPTILTSSVLNGSNLEGHARSCSLCLTVLSWSFLQPSRLTRSRQPVSGFWRQLELEDIPRILCMSLTRLWVAWMSAVYYSESTCVRQEAGIGNSVWGRPSEPPMDLVFGLSDRFA